jgi:hypothetical protein
MADDMTPFDVTEEEGREEEDRPQQMDRQATHRTHRSWTNGPWIGGAVLILLGIVALLQNLDIAGAVLQNWWAVFILIPAARSFERAWRHYQSSGSQVTRSVTGSLLGGLALTMVAMTFLFGLDWSLMLPIFLIVAGIGALFSGLAAF